MQVSRGLRRGRGFNSAISARSAGNELTIDKKGKLTREMQGPADCAEVADVADEKSAESARSAGNNLKLNRKIEMLLYNVTYGVDRVIEKEWLEWMKEQFIPVVMQAGMFTDWKMYKILHDQEDGTVSYSVQYFASTIDKVVQFVEQIEPELNKEHQRKFKDRHVAFRTLLEEV